MALLRLDVFPRWIRDEGDAREGYSRSRAKTSAGPMESCFALNPTRMLRPRLRANAVLSFVQEEVPNPGTA